MCGCWRSAATCIFVEEALSAHGGHQVLAEHLERDRPSVPAVPRQVHGGHAALAQLAIELVTLAEDRAEVFQALLFQQIDH